MATTLEGSLPPTYPCVTCPALSCVVGVLRSRHPLKFNRGDWGGEGWTDRQTVKIPLVGRNGWEPATATDLRNIFLDDASVVIKRDFAALDVESGVAGKPSSTVVHDVVRLEIVQEKSVILAGLTEVIAEG